MKCKAINLKSNSILLKNFSTNLIFEFKKFNSYFRKIEYSKMQRGSVSIYTRVLILMALILLIEFRELFYSNKITHSVSKFIAQIRCFFMFRESSIDSSILF